MNLEIELGKDEDGLKVKEEKELSYKDRQRK